MHFTHYQITGGKVFAVCPFQSPTVEAMKHDLLSSRNFFDFKAWSRKQPEITSDPSIKDGVYAKELFEEPIWQYQSKSVAGDNFGKWFKVSDWMYEHTYKDSIYNTRRYIRLKHPVKQEEKEGKKYCGSSLKYIDTDFVKLKNGLIQVTTATETIDLSIWEIEELYKFSKIKISD